MSTMQATAAGRPLKQRPASLSSRGGMHLPAPKNAVFRGSPPHATGFANSWQGVFRAPCYYRVHVGHRLRRPRESSREPRSVFEPPHEERAFGAGSHNVQRSCVRSRAMKAMTAAGYGPLEQLQSADAPMPTPGRGEVRVRTVASALNPADYKVLLGTMKFLHARNRPLIVGYDFSGTVDAVGPGVARRRARGSAGVHHCGARRGGGPAPNPKNRRARRGARSRQLLK